MTRGSMKTGQAIIVFLMVLGVSGCIDITKSAGTPTKVGFHIYEPVLEKTSLNTKGVFNGTFKNKGKNEIKINNMKVKVDILGGSETCSGKASVSPTIVGNNNEFNVLAKGCRTGNGGDAYEIQVNLNYSINIDDKTYTKLDYGSIRGPVT